MSKPRDTKKETKKAPTKSIKEKREAKKAKKEARGLRRKAARIGMGKDAPGAPHPRDRHLLYERAVQSPLADVRFFDRLYRKRNGRLPCSLREDFCGTAAVATEWVRRRAGNTALGIDLDEPTLRWGMRHNLATLGADVVRVNLRKVDVRRVRRPRMDVVAALNFSYFVFKTRPELLSYFRSVRASLAPGGLFVADIFGGSEAQALRKERRRCPGFTYIWEQVAFDPITHETRFHIHFRFPDGTERKRAFTYDWRLWTIPEVLEILTQAGFSQTQVYWEATDRKRGIGNGTFRQALRADTTPGWIAYLVAS